MLLEPQLFIDALMLFEQAIQTRMHVISPLGQNNGLIGGSAAASMRDFGPPSHTHRIIRCGPTSRLSKDSRQRGPVRRY
jgi:hypothetical protein